MKFKNLKNKLFKKNQYNFKNNTYMSETKEDILKFQWKKGERFGKVVEVKSQDDKFYYFTDGSQIFKNVASEFLEKVHGDTLPFPGADVVNLTGGSVKNKSKQPTAQKQPEPVNKPTSELHGLINKLSKKNMVDFQPVIHLNVPTVDIFNMLIENSDENEEELLKTITEVAVSQIEIDKLREYLQEEITNFLNNYYNG